MAESSNRFIALEQEQEQQNNKTLPKIGQQTVYAKEVHFHQSSTTKPMYATSAQNFKFPSLKSVVTWR